MLVLSGLNVQVPAVSVNAAEKSETCVGPLESTSTDAPVPGERILEYAGGMVNDSSPITLSDESLSGTTKVETIETSSKKVDKGPP